MQRFTQNKGRDGQREVGMFRSVQIQVPRSLQLVTGQFDMGKNMAEIKSN
jgi:hypothetical protein